MLSGGDRKAQKLVATAKHDSIKWITAKGTTQ